SSRAGGPLGQRGKAGGARAPPGPEGGRLGRNGRSVRGWWDQSPRPHRGCPRGTGARPAVRQPWQWGRGAAGRHVSVGAGEVAQR
ncbi:unnamed protein product, partial [Gulo gulo]